MKKTLKHSKGITLVALVITIIILLILAGISISSLTQVGLLKKANEAKIEEQLSKIEELATLEVYQLYASNADNMGTGNDATITTALKAELQKKGYETRDANTTSEKVKGLKIQDSTGQNSLESITLVQQKETTIKIDLDKKSESKMYIKVNDNWYEIIINNKTVKVSRDKHDEPVDSKNTYEIKLTPPTSGITMTAGGKQITSETTITPGAFITIQAKNDVGNFPFTVKETTSSVTKTVNVNVEANPKYATDLSIAVEGGEDAKVAPSKTLQLVATKEPATSTDNVIWKIKSGNATIDAAGLVTANSNATIGSKITVSATCNREDGTTTTVGEKTFVITVQKELLKLTAQQIAENPKLYYGKEVVNYKASSSDTKKYRIFYVDTEDYFKDGANTIYLKADVSSKGYRNLVSYDVANTKIRKMNPLWAEGKYSPKDTTGRGENESKWFNSEKAAAYLCSPVNETTYSTTTLPWKSSYNSDKANYVIGGPSIEMYVKSYNQVEAYKNATADEAKYKLGASYKTSYPGYIYTINGTQSYSLKTYGETGKDSLDYSSTYNSMYCGNDGRKETSWYLSSPIHFHSSACMCYVDGGSAQLKAMGYSNAAALCPLVALKSTFQPQIEE